MKLLSDIINDLIDPNTSLATPLLKTKVLATRVDNAVLLEWVNNESNGYSNSAPIPDYRTIRAKVNFTFVNGNMKHTNDPTTIKSLPIEQQNKLQEVYFKQSVATLESLANSSGSTSIGYSVPQVVLQVIEDLLNETNPYLQIIDASRIVPIASITQTLSVVRSTLLDFMLGLEKELGAEIEIEDLRKNKGLINQSVNNTFNTSGSGNIISTGGQASITANISIVQGDQKGLRSVLEGNGVSSKDVDDLLNVIDNEQPDNGTRKFGGKVNQWIQSMLAKALDGSWQVGIEVAGGLLANVIGKYYGVG